MLSLSPSVACWSRKFSPYRLRRLASSAPTAEVAAHAVFSGAGSLVRLPLAGAGTRILACTARHPASLTPGLPAPISRASRSGAFIEWSGTATGRRGHQGTVLRVVCHSSFRHIPTQPVTQVDQSITLGLMWPLRSSVISQPEIAACPRRLNQGRHKRLVPSLRRLSEIRLARQPTLQTEARRAAVQERL